MLASNLKLQYSIEFYLLITSPKIHYGKKFVQKTNKIIIL